MYGVGTFKTSRSISMFQAFEQRSLRAIIKLNSYYGTFFYMMVAPSTRDIKESNLIILICNQTVHRVQNIPLLQSLGTQPFQQLCRYRIHTEFASQGITTF
jgi:hypothetical protein